MSSGTLSQIEKNALYNFGIDFSPQQKLQKVTRLGVGKNSRENPIYSSVDNTYYHAYWQSNKYQTKSRINSTQ